MMRNVALVCVLAVGLCGESRAWAEDQPAPEFKPEIDEAAKKELEERLAKAVEEAKANPDKAASGDHEGRLAKKKILDQFDKDNDGKLNEEEKAEAMAALKDKKGDATPDQIRERLKERFDADGDGKLSDEERAKMEEHLKKMQENKGEGDGGKHPMMEKFLERQKARFDKDGDGELNDAERKEAKEAFEKFMKERKGMKRDGAEKGEKNEE
ncbi:MAG: hypothetical protein L6R28_23220 [Planctomycetes bacterium]|nr:hypothetical protein [Planctomycetota bacterium]